MIEIKYNTRVYIDKKTNRVKIRARWNGQEVCFALDCRADSTKWDGKAQRPMAGTVHKFDDQNCTARVLTVSIENALDKIKTAFTKCELDGFVPSKEVLRTMVRGEEKGREEVKLKKTLEELYEEFMTVVSDDHNWTEKVHYKYKQAWDQLHEYHPDITLETISKSKLRELKNWYVNHGYRNVSVKKQFSFLRTFLRWLQNEGYELQPGVLEYVPNLTVVPKTVTFLKYDELMDFYHYKFPEDKKDWDLVRDMFCFMAFTSLRYSDMVNLKKANIMGDHLEICTQKTHDKLSIPITQYAQEIIDKYKDEDYKDGKMFKMYANQIINHLLKEAAKEAGLNREVMQVYYKGSKRYEEVKKFHEVIGCHDGRRTFVCCSLAFGIPPTVVMSCTGHSTYQSMRPYIEVSDETQRTELAKWDQKANEKSTLKGDVAKKLASVDEETLKKVLELLNSQK